MPFLIVVAVRVLGGAAFARYVALSPGSGQPGYPALGKAALEQLRRTDLTDEQLSTTLSDLTGYDLVVATYEGAFELRKLQLMFSHQDQAVATDDQRVITIHFIKLAAGVPTDAWVQADFDAIMTAINTFWTAIRSHYTNEVVLDRAKFYKDGPGIEPPQIPVFDQELNVAGTNVGDCMPPQTAVSVTEKAGSKLHWGRFYLPAPAVTTSNTYGRIGTVFQTAVADAADALYESFITANVPAVVYRRELPEREKVSGAVLPARDATAWTVTDIQVDDVWDVIRSRRWKYPLTRIQRAIAGA
jgi:hypothetical protein